MWSRSGRLCFSETDEPITKGSHYARLTITGCLGANYLFRIIQEKILAYNKLQIVQFMIDFKGFNLVWLSKPAMLVTVTKLHVRPF